MKTVFRIDVIEQLETPCDFCYGVAAGVGIGLAVVALT